MALTPLPIVVGIYDDASLDDALSGAGRLCLTYLLTDGTHLKIGRARDVPARIKALQTGNPRPLRLLAILQANCEMELAGRFERLNVRGEWYVDDPSIRAAFGVTW